MRNYVLYYSGARNQQFYIKPETSGIHLKNLNLNIDGGLTVGGTATYNISTTGSIFANNLIYNTGVNNISGTLTANNLVYNTGNQTISGVKTFANDINASGTGTFAGLNLENINNLFLSGMNINITGGSVVNVFNPIRISGNEVVTKSGSINAETIIIDRISGATAGLRIGTPSTSFGADIILQIGRPSILGGNIILRDGGLSDSATTIDGSNTIINSTGNPNYIFLIRKSGSVDSIRATNTSVNINNLLTVSGNPVLTGVDLSSYATITNLASTGSTLQTNINNLSGYINSTGSNIVFTTGNQTISGNKTFTNNIIYSVSPRTSGTNFTPNADIYTFFDYVLTGNSTLNEPTNMSNGESITIFLNQDGSGSRTMSFNSSYLFSNGITPTLSFVPSGVDIMQVIRVNNRYFTTFASNY